jgi:eukaryotic-like serine/threonine-protein kinase
VRYAQPGYLLFAEGRSVSAWAFDPRRLMLTGESIPIAGVQPAAVAAYLPTPVSVSQNGILAYTSGSPSILAWLDRSGNVKEVIGHGSSPSVSRDGNRIVVSRGDPRTGKSDIWLFDRAKGVESRLTFEPGDDLAPSISPDGEQILFLSTRAGVTQLYRKPVNVVGGEEIVGAPESSNPDWSADGRFVVYQKFDSKTEWNLWAFSLTGDRAPVLIAGTEHGERAGRFSPDGRWVAYDSTETGRREVWVQPFPPNGSRWQISTTGGSSPHWSGDGKELFYVAADGMVIAVAVGSGGTFDRGAPKPLFQTIFRGGGYANYAVSHDGQRFIMTVPPGPEDATPITVVTNWTALLRK